MLDPLRLFIRQRRSVEMSAVTPTESPHDEIQLAATALLLEFSYADGSVSPPERQAIESSLSRHFNLDLPSVQELLRLADEARRQSADPAQLTGFLCEHLDVGQRVVLAEVMYRAILSDGRVPDLDLAVMQKLAARLDISPSYLAIVRERLGLATAKRA